MIKNSEPYQHALSHARSNPAVVAALGEPIKPGLLFSGSIHLNNDAGDADLSIPVSGPKGSGTLHVVGSKSAGKWTYSTLTFAPAAGGNTVDLSAGGP